MTDITMPRLSDSMEEGTILRWLKQEGEHVDQGEELVEIETDKATMTYESPEAGTVHIVASEGTTLAVGAPIAQLGEGAAAAPAPPAAAEAAPAAAAGPDPVVEPVGAVAAPAAPPSTNGHGAPADAPRATPLARRLAAEHDVDLATVTGTGPRGRVTRGDVAAAASVSAPSPVPAPRSAPAGAPAAPSATPAPAPASAPSATRGAKGGSTIVELTRLQQVIARRMSEAKATVPEFQVQTEVAMDALLALRAQLKEATERPPSVNDFVVKASALALREFPRANGSYKDGAFELHERVNVGVAVAADDALIVPTIADADTRSLGAIAVEARRLAAAVRDGTVTPPELAGATFTVSNLGMYGMTAITPVINPPQAAILGVGALRAVPALVDGELRERQLMTLTLTCDHRILYGADAAQFLSRIRERLEQPLLLAL